MRQRGELDRAFKTVRFDKPPRLLYRVLNQRRWDKSGKTFPDESDQSRCSAVIQLPLCSVRTAPDVSGKKGKYIWGFFNIGFWKVCKSFHLIVTLSLIDTLLHSFQLESFLWRSSTQRWRSRWYGAIFTVSHRWSQL